MQALRSSLFAGHAEMGVLFGALMLLTRNVWATTFVHAIVNMRPGYQVSSAMIPWFDPYPLVAVVLAALWLRNRRSRAEPAIRTAVRSNGDLRDG